MPTKKHDDGADVLENVVEKYLVAEATLRRVVCKKTSGPGWRSWPDRLLFWGDGIVHLAETKRPKKWRYEALQQHKHAELRKDGYVVVVLLTKSQVDAYFRKYEHLRAVKVPRASRKVSMRQARSEDASRKCADDIDRVARQFGKEPETATVRRQQRQRKAVP